jgi:hypothetical protein
VDLRRRVAHQATVVSLVLSTTNLKLRLIPVSNSMVILHLLVHRPDKVALLALLEVVLSVVPMARHPARHPLAPRLAARAPAMADKLRTRTLMRLARMHLHVRSHPSEVSMWILCSNVDLSICTPAHASAWGATLRPPIPGCK